jgi:hypothetical protein
MEVGFLNWFNTATFYWSVFDNSGEWVLMYSLFRTSGHLIIERSEVSRNLCGFYLDFNGKFVWNFMQSSWDWEYVYSVTLFRSHITLYVIGQSMINKIVDVKKMLGGKAKQNLWDSTYMLINYLKSINRS